MDVFLAFFTEKTALELLAVALGLAYLVLAMKQNIWCWPAAFISTAIYIWLFWHVSLLMDSALNVYFLVMAVYGFWMWRTNRPDDILEIKTWSMRTHVFTIITVVFVSVISGYLLSENTKAAWPYLDSFTTWASILTTYMVANKILENWIYWIVIDSVAMFLYIERGLHPTALLFFVYLILCVFGFISWKKQYINRCAADKIGFNSEAPA